MAGVGALRRRSQLWARFLVVVALALAWVPQKIFGSHHVPEPINSFVLIATCITFALALRRMMMREAMTERFERA